MYALIWRSIPGPRFVKLVVSLALFAAVVAICFTWVFPAVEPYVAFNDNAVHE